MSGHSAHDRATPQILAAYDDEGVWVYQAFKESIADAALALGTFGAGFTLDRMTWIKPSFGWMLYRSGYATKRRQTRILKIKITHAFWLDVLEQGVCTMYDPSIHDTQLAWAQALRDGDVRYQWDPERDLQLRKTGARALQVGIRGAAVRRYVAEGIVGLEDATALAHEIRDAVRARRRRLPGVPDERPYPVTPSLARVLGMSSDEQAGS